MWVDYLVRQCLPTAWHTYAVIHHLFHINLPFLALISCTGAVTLQRQQNHQMWEPQSTFRNHWTAEEWHVQSWGHNLERCEAQEEDGWSQCLTESLVWDSEKSCCYSLVGVLGNIRLSYACRGKNKQEATVFIVNSISTEIQVPSPSLTSRVWAKVLILKFLVQFGAQFSFHALSLFPFQNVETFWILWMSTQIRHCNSAYVLEMLISCWKI